MKKIHILTALLFALPLLTLTSCLKDEKDVFSESASTRLQNYITETRKVLMQPENGWVIDYYYGSDQAYGGMTLIVKFDSLECTAMSEKTGDETCTTYYKLTTDNGPVLTFDSYNEVLHKLATPSLSSYEGKHADFEMTVMSVSPELVVLKGKKTDNYMYMRPLQGSATEYLQKINAMSDSMIVSTAEGTMADGMDIKGTFDVGNRSVTFTSESDTTLNLKVAYTYTDTGLRLYKDVYFGLSSISNLVYNGSDETLTAPDSDFKLVCQRPDGWTKYEDFAGTYNLFCKEGKDSVTCLVTLTPDADGEGYLLSGLNSTYDLKLTYEKSVGVLQLSPQWIASDGGYDLYLCMLDKDAYYLTANSEAGLYLKSAGSSNPGVFNFMSNGNEDFVSGSIVLWLVSDGDFLSGTEVRSWLQSHTQYLFGDGYMMLPTMKTMTKVE